MLTSSSGAGAKLTPVSIAYSGTAPINAIYTAPLSPVAPTATVSLQTARGTVLAVAGLATTCSAEITPTSVPPTSIPGVVSTLTLTPALPLAAVPTFPFSTPIPVVALQPGAIAAVPAAGGQAIRPPNTGDAGLVKTGERLTGLAEVAARLATGLVLAALDLLSRRRL